ncbi:MYND-type zinc finger protein samB [Fusarium sp. LHS14.1]|nr:MYND-type zinc finger protein samB [Fusarium sp. LHS14.1]
MTLPHLDIHGADVFEYPDFLERHPALNHIIAILLLKLKLLVDIRNLKMTRKILALRRVPHDLWQSIELSAIRNPLSLKLQRDSPEALIQTEEELLFQTHQLGVILQEANYSFMYYFFDQDEALCARPERYSRGSWEEMALAMQNSYAAWWETEGILDLLNEARACAARSSGRDVETMVAQSSDSLEAEELLADLNVKQIWHHLDEAFKNTSYLGPWSERPSERHLRQREEILARYMLENITFIAG